MCVLHLCMCVGVFNFACMHAYIRVCLIVWVCAVCVCVHGWVGLWLGDW